MVLQAKCIEKIRDKNKHIIEYKLISKDKKTISVKSDDLKSAMRSGQIEVINLTLTSDNRLIDKKQDALSKHINTPSKPNVNIENLLNKVRTLGYIINTFETKCGHKCYIASSMNHLKHMFIIPDDVKYIYSPYDRDIRDNKLYEYMSNIEGTLRVMGGKSLISAQRLFERCKAQSIDLSSFDTSNVTNMRWMFCECKAECIDLSSFDTSNVTVMHGMFDNCKVHSIDLSSFDTSNVINMHAMFAGCKVQLLDLSSFDTSNVTDMSGMFNGCKVHSIDLRSFDTSNVTNMESMFEGCEAQSIDLSSFNTSNVTDMCEMFLGCEAQFLDLSSFNTGNVTNMQWMFLGCKAQSIDLTSFNTSNVTDMYAMFCECKAQIKVNNPKLKYQLQSDRR